MSGKRIPQRSFGYRKPFDIVSKSNLFKRVTATFKSYAISNEKVFNIKHFQEGLLDNINFSFSTLFTERLSFETKKKNGFFFSYIPYSFTELLTIFILNI